MCVNQESRFVPKDTYTTTSSLIPDLLEIDKISLEILQQCGLDNVIPFNIESKTTGSCLFDSVSVLLHGDESLSTELRVKTCVEMVQNQTFYETHERAVGFMACSPVFEKACLDCASPRGWSSIWTMLALANVVNKNIQSIYPAMNGKVDRAHKALNCMIASRIQEYLTVDHL